METALLGGQHRVHLRGCFPLQLTEDVRAHVEGDADVGVPQRFRHEPWVNALREQERGASSMSWFLSNGALGPGTACFSTNKSLTAWSSST